MSYNDSRLVCRNCILVGMNTNINTLMESQKQEKQVKGATGKNPNSTPDASAATP